MNDDNKAFDFLSENGWENIPAAEREAFRRKLNEAQGKRADQTGFSNRVAVACAIGMLLALIMAALTSCCQP